MSRIIESLKNFFSSKKKRYINAVMDVLSKNSYVILDQINTKLSLEERYEIIESLIKSSKLDGFIIKGKHIYFLSIPNNLVKQIRESLKSTGRISLQELNEKLQFKGFLFNAALQRIEKGYVGKRYYYSRDYIRKYISDKLNKVKDTFEIRKISEEVEIEEETIISIIMKLIEHKELSGLIRNEKEYITTEYFEKLLTEQLDELFEKLDEISFKELSQRLGVKEEELEPFLVKILEANPLKYTLYPLEKRLCFKK